MARVFPVLRTPRLTLRPPEPGDASAIAREIGNYDVARWLVSVPYPYDERHARSFVAECEPGKIWVIEDCRGLCGAIDTRGELGYWLARGAWGRGYLTEAGDAVLDAYFDDRRNRSLVSGHMEGNARSAHVLGKLGFERVGPSRVWSVSLGQDVASVAMRLSRERWQERRSYRLSTRRLRLRDLQPGDLDAVKRLIADPSQERQPTWLPHPFAGEDAARWLEDLRYRGRPGFGVAIRSRTGRLVGVMLLERASEGPAPTFRAFLAPAYRGQGLMREGASAFLADAMGRFGLDHILAAHPAGAGAAGRFLNSLGFEEADGEEGRTTRRLEPGAPVIYRLSRSNLRADP